VIQAVYYDFFSQPKYVFFDTLGRIVKVSSYWRPVDKMRSNIDWRWYQMMAFALCKTITMIDGVISLFAFWNWKKSADNMSEFMRPCITYIYAVSWFAGTVWIIFGSVIFIKNVFLNNFSKIELVWLSWSDYVTQNSKVYNELTDIAKNWKWNDGGRFIISSSFWEEDSREMKMELLSSKAKIL